VNFWGVKLPRIIEDPRELILSEAKKILENEGYSQISIRRVAKECGIAVGTIYNYFPTKKGLIIEMMTDFWEEYFCDIEPI
jgi:AcrR family transcriptional regulator